MENNRLWVIEDVALYLGIPHSSVYKMTAARSTNPIPHLKIGGLLRFRKHEIDQWLDLWAVSSLGRLKKAAQRARRTHGTHSHKEAR